MFLGARGRLKNIDAQASGRDCRIVKDRLIGEEGKTGGIHLTFLLPNEKGKIAPLGS